MKLKNILVIVFLTLTACVFNINTRHGASGDYDFSFFAAGQDLSPCSIFMQSEDIYLVLRLCNKTDDILIENAAFPTPLHIQVLDSAGIEVFDVYMSEQLPNTINIFPDEIISDTFLWNRFKGKLISPDSPIPEGIYTVMLHYWAHSYSAIIFELSVKGITQNHDFK